MTVSHLRAASASGRVPSLVTNGGTRRFADAQTFVERWTGAPGGYRIPALVRELLTARLAYDAPEEFAALRRLCAE